MQARPLSEVFAAERPRLVGLAYRMTGSRLDAEDIVQDAWLRAERADWDAVERPEAWLTTVVSRLALDTLKSAQRQRERYVGPWLAEPVLTGPSSGTGRGAPPTSLGGCGVGERRTPPDPADMSALADSLALGFLRLLEELSPLERVVFILADVFDTPFRDIAETVERSPGACRQIASRARRRLRATGPGGHTDPDGGGAGGGDRAAAAATAGEPGVVPRHDPVDQATRVAEDLAAALVEGQMDKVVALLAEDVVVFSDGGADYHAARRPVRGRDRVARFMVNLVRREDGNYTSEMPEVNGEPGAVVWVDGELFLAMGVRVLNGRVQELHMVRNVDKLAALDLPGPLV